MSKKDDIMLDELFPPELEEWREEVRKKVLKEQAQAADLPKPTHYPHLGPKPFTASYCMTQT